MPTYQSLHMHMRRFWSLASPPTNKQIVYLHVLCQMSIPHIAYLTGISQKTALRILLGQRPNKQQLRKLRTLCSRTAKEFLRMRNLTKEHLRYGQVTNELLLTFADLGKELAREYRPDD
jgi:hypothetical protein